MSIPVVSLYSGAGGLDLGFATEGFAPTFANDIDHPARLNYEAVMSRAGVPLAADHYVVGDLSEDFSSLRRREDSILIGGPPCQGFSQAGLMDPRDPRSRHVRHFVDAVASVRPRAFVMENVSALAKNLRWRPILEAVKGRAEKLGYECTVVIANAKFFGAPQSRERMFLIGIKSEERGDLTVLHQSTSIFEPVPTHIALARVASYAEQPRWQKSPATIVPARTPVIRKSPFAGMLFNGQGRPLDLAAPSPTLSASLGGNHTPIVDQAWVDDPQNAGRSIHEYHAQLLRGTQPRVPSSWRRLSLLEAAEIQTFPRGANWLEVRSTSLRHIGNAVPPLLGSEIARRLRKALS